MYEQEFQDNLLLMMLYGAVAQASPCSRFLKAPNSISRRSMAGSKTKYLCHYLFPPKKYYN